MGRGRDEYHATSPSVQAIDLIIRDISDVVDRSTLRGQEKHQRNLGDCDPSGSERDVIDEMRSCGWRVDR